MASSRRRLLNQSTHSRVANLTASSDFQGPLQRTIPVFNRPMIVLARALWKLSHANGSDGRLDTGGAETVSVADRNVLHPLDTLSVCQVAICARRVSHRWPMRVNTSWGCCASGGDGF
jgi:hypothetical protein